MISLRQVSKRFGARLAVDNLTLRVERGGIFGLLGHNGAGKSTTIGMLLGQVFPDAGAVEVAGADVFRERGRALARVGAIFETPAFYDYLSGRRNLRMFATLTGPVAAARLDEVTRLVGLAGRIDDRVATYSHGMRQRLALAQALLPEPELLILDEPSEGLDPEGIHEMRQLILRLNRDWGLTILFSSHLLGEVQQLCSQLAVMKEGKLLFQGDWRSWGVTGEWACVRVDRQAEAEQALCAAGLTVRFEAEGRALLAPRTTIAALAAWLVGRGFAVQALQPLERTLEDFYLRTVRASGEGTHVSPTV